MRAPQAALACLLAACAPSVHWSALSPDHRVGLLARRHHGQTCLLVTGRLPQCHDGIALDALVFSDSGNHLAYPARAGTRWMVVRDGRPGAPWDGVAAPVFSRDGSRLAYAAQDSGGWRIVVNDTAGEPFDSLFTGSITFDPSGRRLGYVAQRGDSAAAVVDGVTGTAWSGLARLSFSADGAHVAYLARTPLGAVLVVDGRAGEPHEGIAGYALAPNGGRSALVALDGGLASVIAAAGVLGRHDAVRALAFGPTGTLVWIAREGGRERMFAAGVDGGAVGGPPFDSVTAPVFAARGSRWGYLGRDSAGAAVVLDGAVLAREESATDLALSAEGARHAWIARRGGRAAVVDEHGAHPFDLLVAGTLVFLDDGRWACLAGERRDRELFVVIEGRSERLPFSWSENARLARRDPTGAAVRAWVRAEAERRRQ